MIKSEAAQPHPAAVFFGAKLRALMAESQIRDVDTGKTRKLTALGLYKLLQYQFPDSGISQTHVYRYVNGERPPRLDQLATIAALFGVSPTHFVDDRRQRGRG